MLYDLYKNLFLHNKIRALTKIEAFKFRLRTYRGQVFSLQIYFFSTKSTLTYKKVIISLQCYKNRSTINIEIAKQIYKIRK